MGNKNRELAPIQRETLAWTIYSKRMINEVNLALPQPLLFRTDYTIRVG